MSGRNRVVVDKKIYQWAIEESQLDINEIANKHPKLHDWMSGVSNPTFKQLHKLAKDLKVPFGFLFLKEPPQRDIMATEFRSINNKHPNLSKNLKDTIKSMDFRRNWMSDYRRELGWAKLDIIINFKERKKNEIQVDAKLIKELIELDSDWHGKIRDYNEAYNFLKTKLENQGILVMQNGVVGTYTRRKLDIDEFRAFMLYDDYAPLIFINTNDSIAGKIFSLIHELIHVLQEDDDLLVVEDQSSHEETERYINELTSEILIPREYIETNWQDFQTEEEIKAQLGKLAKHLKVSETALAIKLRKMRKIEQDIVDDIIQNAVKYLQEVKVKEGDGGDYYNTYKSRLSPNFLHAVIRSTEAGEVQYSHAFRLLDVSKASTYNEIREREELYV